MENPIVAISTASGNAGIGIVRLSGEGVFDILNKIFIPVSKDKTIKGYTMKYGKIIDKDEDIDEVLVSYFIGPKSYTREDMVEINTHGGIIVEKKILDLCLRNGAELAKPGEFTKRAFLNGRIDLSQAEAIINLINAKTDKEASESLNQLEGNLSKTIEDIEHALLNTITAVEVSIDYPEYDIDELEGRDELKELIDSKEKLDKLEKSFEVGKILRDGISTAIIGKPNAGKSSLLNSILKEDRAIVSDIEGTTRDTIEEFVNVNGIPLKIVDTAGIRKTDNEIEKIGVQKAKKLAESSDLIIAIFDITKKLGNEDKEILNEIKDKNVIILLNKIDLKNDDKEMMDELSKYSKPIFKISAKNNQGVDKLYSEVEKMFKLDKIELNNDVVITNERHKIQIIKAKENIERAINSIKNNMPMDICSIYIKEALEDLGEITGKNVSEDIINEIFKNFCLGK